MKMASVAAALAVAVGCVVGAQAQNEVLTTSLPRVR
jgi:hypothetical protein